MKEIKISFSITLLLDRCDVNHVEEELLKKREEVFKGIMVRVLDEIEKERLRQEVRCPACEGEVIKKGSEVRKIETLIGGIRYRRARFKCKECGGEFYPLDNALGLEPQRKCTLGVIERALWAATEVSYAKSAEFLKKFTGLEISHGQIHNEAVEEGRRISEWEQKRREEVFEEGKDAGESRRSPEILYIQVDGTAVNDRSSRQWMECKTGAAFKGLAWIKRRANVEEAEKIAATMHYIETNQDWIENIPKVEGYGSGPVEKTVDITVARRLKRRGMSWYKDGANPLLKLRLLRLNGDWDGYWSKRKKDCATFLAA